MNHVAVVLNNMLKEFEGIIGTEGLHEFGEFGKRLDIISQQPVWRFRAVLDSAVADAICFAISFGQRRQALRLLLESSVSFEQQIVCSLPFKPEAGQSKVRVARSKLRLIK